MENILDIGSVVFFVLFVIGLFVGAHALDGGFDTMLLKCRNCGKICKAKTKGCHTYYTNCIFCKSTNTQSIGMVSKSYKISGDEKPTYV